MSKNETDPAFTWASATAALRCDLRNNPRDPRAWFVLIGLRTCQALMRRGRHPHPISWPAIALYRFVTEFILSMELRPSTSIGPGLTIYHGFGIVVNDYATIGADVKIRNGVVIGNRIANGPCPVIEDGVEIGANAIVIGDIHVGKNARIGAGAVVTRSVGEGAVVVGNPARPIR